MKKRTFILLAGAVGIAAAAGFITRSSWMGGSSNAQGPQRPRLVSVDLVKAERKSVPVDVDANGTVTPISSVALKSRLETTIVAVHFEDGARVNEGDLLFTLDSRQIDAQIEQDVGVLAKDQGKLEGAQRDLRRYNDLVGKGATTQVNVDNARTQSDILTGTIKADQAALDKALVEHPGKKVLVLVDLMVVKKTFPRATAAYTQWLLGHRSDIKAGAFATGSFLLRTGVSAAMIVPGLTMKGFSDLEDAKKFLRSKA
jgi:hypothetical protein